MIKTYGEWIDITEHGTSGDQVMDILESWKSDAQKLLAEINKLENIISMRSDEIQSAASILGSIKTEKKAASSRENGKKGGRPKKAI